MAVEVLRCHSTALRGNPLGDPHVRDLHVVVPDDLDASRPVPAVWYLSGHAGVGRAMLAHDPWQEGIDEKMARLAAEGAIGRMLVVLPDAFNKFGGSQYLGSSAVGDYETYLFTELRELLESRFKISAHAIAGKSSGGYGAIHHAMKRPDLFKAVAVHSGDMGFRFAYGGDLPQLLNALHEHGGLEGFVRAFEKAQKKKDGRWLGPISMIALAAVYSADPRAPMGISLPVDLQKGDVDDEVFNRWMSWDPVRLIDDPKHQEALKKMRLVFVDCGRRDEYHLQWGARAFHKKLDRYGIKHEYDEFDDGHRNTSYRLDVSMPKLYRALAG